MGWHQGVGTAADEQRKSQPAAAPCHSAVATCNPAIVAHRGAETNQPVNEHGPDGGLQEGPGHAHDEGGDGEAGALEQGQMGVADARWMG